jgi:hypothetical protein
MAAWQHFQPTTETDNKGQVPARIRPCAGRARRGRVRAGGVRRGGAAVRRGRVRTSAGSR